MKKFFCLMAAMTMLLSACAYAESVPSKTTDDMIQIEIVTDETAGAESAAFIVPVQEGDAANADILAVSAAEIQKIAASATVEEYFGEVKDTKGSTIRLQDLLEADQLNCHEFFPVIAGGFEQQDGATSVRMKVAAPYAAGEKVLVLIGLAAENGIAWTACPAEVDDAGQVLVVLENQLILQIQANKALMAIVSK